MLHAFNVFCARLNDVFVMQCVPVFETFQAPMPTRWPQWLQKFLQGRYLITKEEPCVLPVKTVATLCVQWGACARSSRIGETVLYPDYLKSELAHAYGIEPTSNLGIRLPPAEWKVAYPSADRQKKLELDIDQALVAIPTKDLWIHGEGEPHPLTTTTPVPTTIAEIINQTYGSSMPRWTS